MRGAKRSGTAAAAARILGRSRGQRRARGGPGPRGAKARAGWERPHRECGAGRSERVS